MPLEQGDILWTPGKERREASQLARFERMLADTRGLHFADYEALRQWSVDSLEDFWRAIVEFFDLAGDGSPEPVLTGDQMPGVHWFPNLRINFAEQIFRQRSDDRPALIHRDESGAPPREIGWRELERDVGALAATLRRLGVEQGDRVAAYLPNRPETVVAFLACASIGAIWSSCAPEMGHHVVLDRLSQIEPKVLIAADGYRHGGKQHDRRQAVSELLAKLPSVKTLIHVPAFSDGPPPEWRDVLSWTDATKDAVPLEPVRVGFEHPLWIVYSSGTTGLPKAMVHGHGGAVVTLLKTLALQADLQPGDRDLIVASTGWIVWNVLVGGLLCGATVMLWDGHPGWPDREALWDFIDEQQVSMFGCGAAYLTGAMKDGRRPGATRKFAALKTLISAGSPLPLDAFAWVYRDLKADVWLTAPSGGTDIITSFVSSAPTLPVRAGEIQCAELGVAVFAFDEQGRPVEDEVGELVVTKPMPSMPLFFWNDPDGTRHRDSYFDVYPGLWRHGDWIRFTPHGGCVIYGRSDTTINRFGIRMGTAEIYRVVEEMDEIRDSLVVDLEYLGKPSFMPLFVVLADGVALDEALRQRIIDRIRRFASPRHAPDDIIAVAAIPRTLTGKKMELPVRKMLLGAEPASVASPDAMANPESFATFIDYARSGRVPQAAA